MGAEEVGASKNSLFQGGGQAGLGRRRSSVNYLLKSLLSDLLDVGKQDNEEEFHSKKLLERG
jgi:hypothetical protein